MIEELVSMSQRGNAMRTNFPVLLGKPHQVPPHWQRGSGRAAAHASGAANAPGVLGVRRSVWRRICGSIIAHCSSNPASEPCCPIQRSMAATRARYVEAYERLTGLVWGGA